MSTLPTIKKVGGALIGLAVLVAVLNPLFGIAFDMVGVGDSASAVLEPAPSEFDYVADGESVDTDFEVRPSTGDALGVSGDAYAEIPDPNATTRDDGWALAVTVEPGDIDPENTHLIYAEANGTIVVQYEAGYYSAYYETDDGRDAFVTTPAGGDRQAIGVTYRAASDELALYLDGTQVDTDSPDSTTEVRKPAYEWDGTIDEFRRWETPQGNATHAAYASDAIQVLDPANATHRAMFNDNDPETVYYATGNATLVGDTTLEAGVEPPEMVASTDYELATDPIRIRAVDGGYLDGAPVLFAGGASGGVFSGLLLSLVSVGRAALGLLVVGVLVLGAQAISNELGGGF